MLVSRRVWLWDMNGLLIININGMLMGYEWITHGISVGYEWIISMSGILMG